MSCIVMEPPVISSQDINIVAEHFNMFFLFLSKQELWGNHVDEISENVTV